RQQPAKYFISRRESAFLLKKILLIHNQRGNSRQLVLPF
ncbi:MAG: hypothetical protein ACI9SC_000723, partial [Gammaproteobacteria bacterium]